MPLHLDAITNAAHRKEIFAWLVRERLDTAEEVFCTEDKTLLHARAALCDADTGETLGRALYTLRVDREAQRMLLEDLDLVLDGGSRAPLCFLRRRGETGEIYEAETAGTEQHLIVEAVNRHTVPGALENRTLPAQITVIPFELNIFPDIGAFNAFAGFGQELEAADTGLRIGGFSETFLMPGNADPEACYTFLLGRVSSLRRVTLRLGEFRVPLVLAQAETALGSVPVPLNGGWFDLRTLRVGSLLAMNADVKADLAADADFQPARS